MRDAFRIKVREDGSAVVTGESFSAETHLQAEQFRAWINSKLGGTTVTERTSESHTHSHDGLGEHTHDDEHEHN